MLISLGRGVGFEGPAASCDLIGLTEGTTKILKSTCWIETVSALNPHSRKWTFEELARMFPSA